MASRREPRLVLRFAVASLIAFVLVGAGAMVLVVRYARDRAERTGVFHSTFVADAVLAPAFEGIDLSEPLTGRDYEHVLAVVRERILANGRDVRVKVWSADGTILFSDEPRQVGQRFPEEAEELAEVLDGEVKSEVSALEAAEEAEEREFAEKLLEVYFPLRLDPEGPVIAVAELYQDYAFIQADIDAFVVRMTPMLAFGLLVLYAAVLPLAWRASRELRRRNARLNELLQREQETVIELRDLNQKKDDFVAAASHELRTPLTSILGYLTTLSQPDLGSDPTVRSEFLGAAQRQAKRLQRLISNLLSTARLGEDPRPVTTEVVDLGAVVGGVVTELDAAARVRIDVPRGQPVTTDRGRITEALTNLLDNALKYSPDTSPVEIGASIDPGGFRVWVTDHGTGIDPAEHEAVFERFHQVDQSATRRHGGLGLGLHLSKQLVEELGGSVEVASAPGRGSTFTMAIPLGADRPSQPSNDRSPARMGTGSQFSPGGIGQLHSGL